MIARLLAYPFTGGAVALVLATLAGMIPYVGVVGSVLAGAFTIPIVRSSARNGPAADRMPRLVPPPPTLPGQMAVGAVLFLFYLGPWILLNTLALLSTDVDIPSWLYPFLMLPLLLQVAMVIFMPAAVALVAIEGTPLPAFSRARVMKSVEEMGMAYGGLAAMMLLGGGPVFFLGNWLIEQGLWGEALDALLAAWFWLLLLHLVGRTLRKRQLFDEA